MAGGDVANRVATLVVANEAVGGEELRAAVLAHLEDRGGKVFVVVPALAASPLHHYMGDVDRAIGPAGERLTQTLEELRAAGVEAEGEIGDSDPMVAINDEIQKHHPAKIVLVGHRDEEGAFAEQGLLEQARRDLDLPVTELVVDRGDPEPNLLDVKETSGIAGRRKGPRPSRNWPPLSARNVAGILVAVLGTLVLAFLAAECMSHEDAGALGAACIARILLAIGLALINLAHVVGLMLFQSTGYEGLWSRFFARLSLYGTPAAIAVSLSLGLTM